MQMDKIALLLADVASYMNCTVHLAHYDSLQYTVHPVHVPVSRRFSFDTIEDHS